jgi:hypothetical protein
MMARATALIMTPTTVVTDNQNNGTSNTHDDKIDKCSMTNMKTVTILVTMVLVTALIMKPTNIVTDNHNNGTGNIIDNNAETYP